MCLNHPPSKLYCFDVPQSPTLQAVLFYQQRSQIHRVLALMAFCADVPLNTIQTNKNRIELCIFPSLRVFHCPLNIQCLCIKIDEWKDRLLSLIDPDDYFLRELLLMEFITNEQYEGIRHERERNVRNASRLLWSIVKDQIHSPLLLSALEKTDQLHVANYIRQNKGLFNEVPYFLALESMSRCVDSSSLLCHVQSVGHQNRRLVIHSVCSWAVVYRYI